MQLTPLLSFTLSGKEDMRHTESAALRDWREGASADDAQQHQVGNAPRCRTVALPLDHREVQGVLCQHNEQVSKRRTSTENTFVVNEWEYVVISSNRLSNQKHIELCKFPLNSSHSTLLTHVVGSARLLIEVAQQLEDILQQANVQRREDGNKKEKIGPLAVLDTGTAKVLSEGID